MSDRRTEPGRLKVTASQHLPSGVFEHAVDRRLEVERQRIDRCYNRARAVFAEALVEALLPGANKVVNPTAARGMSHGSLVVFRQRRFKSSALAAGYPGFRTALVKARQGGSSMNQVTDLAPRSRARPGSSVRYVRVRSSHGQRHRCRMELLRPSNDCCREERQERSDS